MTHDQGRTLHSVTPTQNGARRGRPPGANGAETKRRILASARRVFSSVGFDRASLKQIAEDAGVTRNAIANYYASKVELHRAAFESIEEEAVRQIVSQAARVEGPVEERLLAVFRTATELNAADDSFVRFLITSTVDGMTHPELREHAQRQFGAIGKFLESSIADARDRGELSPGIDVSATAQVLVNLLWGLAVDSTFVSSERRTKRSLAALSDLLREALHPH